MDPTKYIKIYNKKYVNIKTKTLELNNFSKKYTYFDYNLLLLKKLISLTIYFTHFTEIHIEFSLLVNLKHLSFRNNPKIKYIPNEITQLQKLISLDLSGTSIQYIPINIISQMPNLEHFYLDSVNLINTNYKKKDYKKIKHLQVLSLSLNINIILSLNIISITNLQKLYLKKTNITDTLFKDIILNIPKLSYLYLDYNEISIIPENIDIKLQHLKVLTLSHNKITNIDLQLFNLTNLLSLYLCYNQIKNISSNINKLVNLIELDLSANKIKHIPEELYDLKNLEHIGLSKNKIEYISPNLCKLQNLISLNLEYNRINQFNIDLSKMKMIKDIKLSNNLLTKIPHLFAKKISKKSIINIYIDNNMIIKIDCIPCLYIKLIFNRINFNRLKISKKLWPYSINIEYFYKLFKYEVRGLIKNKYEEYSEKIEVYNRRWSKNRETWIYYCMIFSFIYKSKQTKYKHAVSQMRKKIKT